MIRVFLAISFFFFYAQLCMGQTTLGENGYTEYIQGNIPIIISAPHGGSLTPETILDRTCGTPTLVTDSNTRILARQIDTAFMELIGCRPHLILCHLKRTKLDCNRNLEDGACGNAEAEVAWNEYYQFIETAQSIAFEEFGQQAIYIDLHGHGHPIQRLELGYLLNGQELMQSDSTIDSPSFQEETSFTCLAENNISGSSLSDLIRGEFAIGSLYEEWDIPAVPSSQQPDPGEGNPFFSGGWNTREHSCYNENTVVAGLQVECNFQGIRDNHENRSAFANTTAEVLREFLSHHTGLSEDPCLTSFVETEGNNSNVRIFPNLLHHSGGTISVEGVPNDKTVRFKILNSQGMTLRNGEVKNESILIDNLSAGMYFVQIFQQGGMTVHPFVVF